MSNVKIVKKISSKIVMGGKITPPENGETADLFDVYGIASDIRTGETDKGPWTALMGAFQAHKIGSDDIMRAGQLFLPDVALNLITGRLSDEDTQSVQFGFRISVRGDDTAITGYVYECENLLSVEEKDPLDMLIKESVLQIENAKAKK